MVIMSSHLTDIAGQGTKHAKSKNNNIKSFYLLIQTTKELAKFVSCSLRISTKRG